MLDQRGPLFALPRELREIIYEYYLIVEGGYAFNPDTDKLTTADNEPIDLALSYTCKLAAVEMRNLGLKVNTINFFTVSISSGLLAAANRVRLANASLLIIAFSPAFNKPFTSRKSRKHAAAIRLFPSTNE